MCVLNVFHLKKMNLHLLQSNVKSFLLASQDAVAHPLPGEMNISQLQGKIEFNTF